MPGRIVSYKLLRPKVFNIAEYPKNDGYKQGTATMVYNFLTESLQRELLHMPGQIL